MARTLVRTFLAIAIAAIAGCGSTLNFYSRGNVYGGIVLDAVAIKYNSDQAVATLHDETKGPGYKALIASVRTIAVVLVAADVPLSWVIDTESLPVTALNVLFRPAQRIAPAGGNEPPGSRGKEVVNAPQDGTAVATP
jgi:hypothetical protein